MSAVPKRRKRPGRKATRGALTVIASLLIGSAILRLGNSAGHALALAQEPDGPTQQAVAEQGENCETPADLAPLLAAFNEREARIEAQEEALLNRTQALRLVDQEVSAKLEALEQAEQELRATIALADSAAEGDLASLTRVYETMKPRQAAALFEEMEPEFAAGFIARMRPEAAAAIMTGLSPEAAHRFSVVLAGRNADVLNK